MGRDNEKNEGREGRGEGEAGTRNPAWNIRENNAPGLEHPGGRKPWTGTGVELEWNVRDLRRRRKWRRGEATRST